MNRLQTLEQPCSALWLFLPSAYSIRRSAPDLSLLIPLCAKMACSVRTLRLPGKSTEPTKSITAPEDFHLKGPED